MKKPATLFLMSILWPCAMFAQSAPFTIEEGPWLQNVGENEFTVLWKSSADAIAWVETAPDDGVNFYGAERPKYYDTHIGQKWIGQLHSVTITGLKPGTTYRYRIFQQEASYLPGGLRARLGQTVASQVYGGSEPYRATTLDAKKNDLSFMMVNDIHGRDSLFRLFVKDVKADKYDFVVFNGDMTSFERSEKEIFDGYLRSASELFATDVPFVMARGNHETRGAFSSNHLDYFPSSTGLPYYTFRQGPAFFLVLDGGEDKPDSDIEYSGLAAYDEYMARQAEWLAGVVESPEFREAPARIVLIHMPPMHSDWYGPTRLAAMLKPLLNGRNIALMMSGHTHRESYNLPTSDGFDFPILINSNKNRVDVKVEGTKITAEIIGPDGKLVKPIVVSE